MLKLARKTLLDSTRPDRIRMSALRMLRPLVSVTRFPWYVEQLLTTAAEPKIRDKLTRLLEQVERQVQRGNSKTVMEVEEKATLLQQLRRRNPGVARTEKVEAAKAVIQDIPGRPASDVGIPEKGSAANDPAEGGSGAADFPPPFEAGLGSPDPAVEVPLRDTVEREGATVATAVEEPVRSPEVEAALTQVLTTALGSDSPFLYSRRERALKLSVDPRKFLRARGFSEVDEILKEFERRKNTKPAETVKAEPSLKPEDPSEQADWHVRRICGFQRSVTRDEADFQQRVSRVISTHRLLGTTTEALLRRLSEIRGQNELDNWLRRGLKLPY